MRLAQGLGVADVVEHEGLRERYGRIAFDGELGHAPTRRAEPALSQSSTVSPGSGVRISTPGASSRNSAGVPVSTGKVP